MNNFEQSSTWSLKLERRKRKERELGRYPRTRCSVSAPRLAFDAFCPLAGGFFRGTEPVNGVIRADEENEEPLPLVWKRVAIKRTAKSQRGENVMLGGEAWAGQAGSA